MKQWSIGSGPAGTLLVAGNPDNPVQTVIQNADPNNTLYIGETSGVNSSNPLESVPVPPGQTYVADGTISVFGIAAPGQNVAVNTLRGFGSFFQPTNLSALGGVAIYNTATAPTQPPTIPLNSLWFTPAGGIEQWNGTTWVPLSFSGQQIISANTIYAAQLAAGIIYAGIVNGTEIDGSIFRVKNSFGATILTLNRSNGTWLLYNDTGSATQGTLAASGAGKGGTDEFGYTFLAGLNSYQIISGDTYALSLNIPSGSGFAGLSIQDLTHPPYGVGGFFGEANNTSAFAFMASGLVTSADVNAIVQAYSQVQWGAAGGGIVLQAGDVQYDLNGNLYDWTATAANELVYTSNVDSNVYNVGTIGRHATALPQTINATANQLITGLSANIFPGLYEIEVNLQFHGNQAAGSPQFQIAQSSGTITNRWGNGIIWDTGTGTNRFVANTSNMIYQGPAMSTNEWSVTLKGFFQCTVAGAIAVYALTSVAADTYVIDNAVFNMKRRN